MDPITIGALIGAGGNALAGLAGGGNDQQKRRTFSGNVSAPRMLRRTKDYSDELRMVLEGLGPIDLSGQNAPLPNDPGGRVQTPQRRPMAAAPAPRSSQLSMSSQGGDEPLPQRNGIVNWVQRNRERAQQEIPDPQGQARKREGALKLLTSLGGMA